MTEEEMQQGWQKILVLEEEMKSAGALVFSGRLNRARHRHGRPRWPTAIS